MSVGRRPRLSRESRHRHLIKISLCIALSICCTAVGLYFAHKYTMIPRLGTLASHNSAVVRDGIDAPHWGASSLSALAFDAASRVLRLNQVQGIPSSSFPRPLLGSSTVDPLSHVNAAKPNPMINQDQQRGLEILFRNTTRLFGRNPVIRPNGRPGAPPLPFPVPDMHAFLQLAPNRPIRSWAPYIHHETLIPYIRDAIASHDRYVKFVQIASTPAPAFRLKNASPGDLYRPEDLPHGSSDKLIEDTVRAGQANYSHIEGSFDWCMARGTPCRSCTVDLARDPAQPLCAPCTHCTAELAWPDTHVRENPTFLARFIGDPPGAFDKGSIVIKFMCIHAVRNATSKRSDPNHLCRKNGGMPPPEALRRSFAQIRSIESIRSACGGFQGIAVPYWTAHVKSVTPEGEIVNQPAIFTRRAFGKPLDRYYVPTPELTRELRDKVLRIPHGQVLLAALHDFIMCESDRHIQNVVFDPERNTITLIDNDMELGSTSSLGQTPKSRPSDPPFDSKHDCRLNSLFLPGNLKFYSMINSPFFANSLDYRCHVNDTADIPLPDAVRQCLVKFARSSPESLYDEYELIRREWAVTLHRRARNLLKRGFQAAILMEQQRDFELHQSRKDELQASGAGWPSNSLLYWRPWTDPFCPLSADDATPRWPRWPRPWEGEPYGPEEVDKF